MSENTFFEKLVIQKSITQKVGEDFYKTSYLIELNLSTLKQDIETVEQTKELAEKTIDKWLLATQHKTLKQTVETKSSNMPDPDDIAMLPWKNYQKKPAAKNDPGWIFANLEDAQLLRKNIEASGGKLQIGDWIYSISDNKKFINRAKPKK